MQEKIVPFVIKPCGIVKSANYLDILIVLPWRIFVFSLKSTEFDLLHHDRNPPRIRSIGETTARAPWEVEATLGV